MPRKIWLVGLDANIAPRFTAVFSSHGYVTEQIPDKLLKFGGDPKPAAVVLSVIESGMPGLNALMSARKAVPPIPVIVITGPDQAKLAIEALKLGAIEVMVMPVDPEDLLSVVRAAHENDGAKASKPEYPQQSEADAAVFLSGSPKMQEIWNVTTTIARANVPVLILGESGVGKEVVARFIQRHSPRADRPMVKVNCAALPADLLESELFGYDRGAFTGAVGEKPGKFELADKGTILLDEIGEMPPNLQAKLLHVLEDSEFSRLGGRRPIKVDVRVLALTNRKLLEAIPRGEFRDDLYYRLNVAKINIPPLRERKGDIPLLVAHFVKRHREGLASSVQELPAEVINSFMQCDWPGNVRQLENTIRRYLILPELDMELNLRSTVASSPSPSDAPKPIMAVAAAAGMASTRAPVAQFPGPNESVSLKTVAAMAAEHAEREIVLHVLEQTNWNRSLAARRLNICYRALLNKLQKWQINRPSASAVRRAG